MRRLISLLAALSMCAISCIAASPAERDIFVKWRFDSARLDASLLTPEQFSLAETVTPALPVNSHDEPELARVALVRAANAEDVPNLVRLFCDDPRVEYAEPRPIRQTQIVRAHSGDRDRLDGVPDDPYYSQQWGLQRIEIEPAWNYTRGSRDVVIAVVDLGVDFSHPELSGQQWENDIEIAGLDGVDDDENGYVDDKFGYDFVDGDGNTTPSPRVFGESHGTHVAGIIAAQRNNGRGIAGVAPDCRIMAVRAGANGSLAYGYEGIFFACRSGARIINCSWGGNAESGFERDIIRYAVEHGCIVVAASGNDINNRTAPLYPAAIEGVVSVAATRLDDRAADFTQYGPWVKISAPGVAIISAAIDTSGGAIYDTWQGTSMAAPFVAGVCGLVASRFPLHSNHQIVARVVSSADPIDDLNGAQAGGLGLGRLNAYRALADSVQGIRAGLAGCREVIGDLDGHIEPGETGELLIEVYNDLGPISDAHAVISTSESFLALQNPLVDFGDILTGGPHPGLTRPRVILPLESPLDRVLPLSLDFLNNESRLIGRAAATIILDSTFVVIENAHMQLGFAENGSIGYHDFVRNYYLGPGLSLPERPTGALYHGSFVLAAEGSVIDNFYGDADHRRFDWVAQPDSFAHFVHTSRASHEVRAVFDDRNAESPLFARVNAAGLSHGDIDAADFLILEYTVINLSVNRWDEVYLGLFMDWDLGPSSKNVSEYDAASSIAYVRAESPGQPLIGVVGLSAPLSGYAVIDNRTQIDAPADWSDARKWDLLRSGIQAPDTQLHDLSQLISVGPMTVEATQSVTAAFAILLADDIASMRILADSARARYLPNSVPIRPGPSAIVRHPDVYPNPLAASEDLHFQVPTSDPATIVIYNITGQEVLRFSDISHSSGLFTLTRQDLGAASGLLFYSIQTVEESRTGKLLILN